MKKRFDNMIKSGKIDLYFYYMYFKDKGGLIDNPKQFMESFDTAVRSGSLNLTKLNTQITNEYEERT